MKSKSTASRIHSQTWMYAMCCAFLANNLAIVVQRGLSNQKADDRQQEQDMITKIGLLVRIGVTALFINIWLAYTFDICRIRFEWRAWQ